MSFTRSATTVDAAVIQRAVPGSCPRDTQNVVTANAPNPALTKSYLCATEAHFSHMFWRLKEETVAASGLVLGSCDATTTQRNFLAWFTEGNILHLRGAAPDPTAVALLGRLSLETNAIVTCGVCINNNKN